MSKKSADGTARGGTPRPGDTTRPADPAQQTTGIMPPEFAALVDESLGLKPISLRLSKQLYERLRIIAEVRGIGYQPLMREVLNEFARNEMLRLAKYETAFKKALRTATK